MVGDIGSCVSALLEGMGGNWPAPPADWTDAVKAKRDENIAKMAPRLMKNIAPMDFHGALGALRTIIKERPDAILVNEGANTLDLARGVIDMYQPRKRLDVGTWGVMGIGMGYAIAAAIETGKPVLAVEGDSAFGFSGMEVETICRYNLPVCVVIFNNNGIYRGTDVNSAGGSDPATTVFVKGSRYDKMMEAFGGVGVNATTPDELKRAVNAAMDSGKPTLINAVIDPAAGSESGRIGNLNPQSVLRRRNNAGISIERSSRDNARGETMATRKKSKVKAKAKPAAKKAAVKKSAAKKRLSRRSAMATEGRGRSLRWRRRSPPSAAPKDGLPPPSKQAVRPGRQGARRREHPRLHARAVGPDLHAASRLVRRRRASRSSVRASATSRAASCAT